MGRRFLDVAAGTCAARAPRRSIEVPAFRREQLLIGADEIALTQRKAEITAYQERVRCTPVGLFAATAKLLIKTTHVSRIYQQLCDCCCVGFCSVDSAGNSMRGRASVMFAG